MPLYPPASSGSTPVNTRYNSTAGQSIPDGAVTIVDFATAVYNNGGSNVTTGAAWKFTAPSTGIYNIASFVNFAAASFTAGSSMFIDVYKNNSFYARIGGMTVETTVSTSAPIGGSTYVDLAATDFMDVRVFQTGSSAARSLTTSAPQVWVAITKAP